MTAPGGRGWTRGRIEEGALVSKRDQSEHTPNAMHRDGRHASVDLSIPHRLLRAHDVLNPTNHTLIDLISDHPARTLIVVDGGLLGATPDLTDRLTTYAHTFRDRMTLVDEPIVIPGGERAKTEHTHYQTVVRAIHDHAICRHSYVIAIGGGAVLDAVGFAASISHRGVRLIRMPTTTLAQDDSGVGVKNGVNAFGKKNFLGAFTVPWAVINDDTFLHTLSARDWRAGFSEAVKVALLKDAALFDTIERDAGAIVDRDTERSADIIHRSALLHLDHIVSFGDPFELRQARPLDFGHWSAHKLEQMTDYRLRHGEAVAIGLALDCTYATEIGLLDDVVRDRIVDLLRALGFAVEDPALTDVSTLLEGLDEFREHLGGTLTVPLITDIARPVDAHEIDQSAMRASIEYLRRNHGRRTTSIAG